MSAVTPSRKSAKRRSVTVLAQSSYVAVYDDSKAQARCTSQPTKTTYLRLAPDSNVTQRKQYRKTPRYSHAQQELPAMVSRPPVPAILSSRPSRDVVEDESMQSSPEVRVRRTLSELTNALDNFVIDVAPDVTPKASRS
ncbi:hypothetical protein ACM66B_006848 [Microbotryomycetes sp. NB124-2]